MTLYTGTGDRGETGLLNGARVSKADARVAATGDVDELCAVLGIALAAGLDAELAAIVAELQRDLFALGARLADPRAQVTERLEKTTLNETSVQKLESWIDQLDASLPTLRQFVLPGGRSGGATLHVARAVCRRAERNIVALGGEAVPGEILRYVNRLSDLLFVMARAENSRRGVQEREW
ncbi:MAG: cob(I)yrinic acid a,c-diamide adenosyltransferase [Vicinamibacterales bacterium]